MKPFPHLVLALMLSTAIPHTGLAQTADTKAKAEQTLSQKEIDQRSRDIGRALRCVVCQNQSIEESDASLAEDMRTLVKARVKAGDSNDAVIAYMQERYGDFVLLKPPVQGNTAILWFAPFLLAGLGLVWVSVQSRRRHMRSPALAVPLTDEELADIDKL